MICILLLLFLCSINARKCDVQQQQQKIPDKNGWYGVDKLSNSIEFYIIESPVQGLSHHIALLGGFPYRKNDIKINR